MNRPPEFESDDIRKLRQEKRLTQQELAVKLGVGIATVKRWEAGESRPRDEHREALLKLQAEIEADPLGDALMNRMQTNLAGLQRMGLQTQKVGPARMRIINLQLFPPTAATESERARMKKEKITMQLDSKLVDRLQKEADSHEVPLSRMMEIILWQYFECPQLSFEVENK